MSKVISIGGMEREELLTLNQNDVSFLLIDKEVLHIFKKLGYAWFYDYEAAKAGKTGLHALLKSLRCSDGFINAKDCLAKHENIRIIFARQIAMKLNNLSIKPDYIVGVPAAASKLGEDVADTMGAKKVKMVKDENGCIKLVTIFESGKSILIVDDVCTKGTGFSEAVREIKKQSTGVNILPYDCVIVNRGGLDKISVDENSFNVLAVAQRRISDWSQEECPLHKMGSEAIKPKITEENWKLITTSQF